MKNFTWLVVPLLVVIYCCNSEKKVLNSETKTQHVVSAWMKRQTFKADTVYNFLPGDTTTTLLVSYDTTTVYDTTTYIVEKTITETKTITNTIRDTVQVSLKCADGADPCALLKRSQDDLANNSIVLEEHRVGEKKQKFRANKWMFLFFASIAVDALVLVVRMYIKYKL